MDILKIKDNNHLHFIAPVHAILKFVSNLNFCYNNIIILARFG